MNIYKIVSNNIKSKIKKNSEIQDALTPELLNSVAVEVPKNRDFGDFSTNVALLLAKPLGKAPRAIAEMIAPNIAELPNVDTVSIAGPGFINIKLKDEFIWNSANDSSKFSNPKPETIDLDYGGYNIGKDLHIGHLRTTVVGDTFNRIAKHLGNKTIAYNHMGDWGRPMGLIIAWILEFGMPKTADDVNAMYPASSARAKEDPRWLEKAKQITTDLQSGNAEYKKIYDVFASISLKQVDVILKRLNTLPFDENKGERMIADYIPEVQKILESKGLIVKDDGAEIIPVKQDTDNAPMPPVMWRSSAGAQTYAAADLTAVYYRKKKDNPDSIIYFTDNRQNLHFLQIFRASRLMGIQDINLQHIGFGAITGLDGKPFKTRDGSVPSLINMMDMVRDSVKSRVEESGKTLTDATIEMIALAALKFNDLMHDVKSDYIFDPDTLTQFEGRTGPYILYTAVRLNSIIKKIGNLSEAAIDTNPETLNEEERALLLTILDFERAIEMAFARRAPDVLANYTYDLCQNINTFYHNCPIMKDGIDLKTKAARLNMVKISLNTLKTAIDLMGLKIPEEM